MREKKKNKQKNKKKGKVRIIVGVMTREQVSDSTLPSEGKEREMEVLSPCRIGEGTNILSPHHGEPRIPTDQTP